MISDDDIFRLIDAAEVARLAQLDFEKSVHAIPFVFVRHEETLYSPVDGKPKRHAKLSRLEWIKREPMVTVLIDEYQQDWTQLWWLRIYGEAKQVSTSEPCWDQLTGQLSEKYPQYEHVDMFAGEPTMLSIKIQRWRYWSASGDKHSKS